MERYNIQLNPELAQLEMGRLRLIPTAHALGQSTSRNIPLPDTLNSTAGRIVEMEAIGRQITKLVVRVQHNDEFDAVYVLAESGGSVWRIVTTWLNTRGDTHATLRRDRFAA